MATVKQILESKGTALYSVTSKTSVKSALQLMSEKNIGALVVIDNNKIIGIFSERDLAHKLAKEGDCIATHLISDYMTTKLTTITSSASIFECMNLMTDYHIRHLPVVENNGELKGMVTIGDIVHAVIVAQNSTIQQLEKYIMGS